MYQLVDPYMMDELKGDAAATESVGAAFAERIEHGADTARPMVLDRWDVETHFFRREASVQVGFLQSLFKGSGKVVKAGVTQEAKQYRVEIREGREVEIGVAVRLAAATSDFSAEVDLSVPNLAAAAQLKMADTRVGIYVVGFAGPLGDILPAPADLNVENFANFIEAFGKIQKTVFNIQNAGFYSPSVLGYFER